MITISTRTLSALIGSALVAAIIGGGLLSSAPAVAADASCPDATTTCTLDGVVYQVDPAEPDRGATVTGGTTALQSFFALPETIDIGGQSYVVTGIADGAFADDQGINRLTLPSGLLSVGDSAFADSALISVVIPASVRSIGPSAFAGVDLAEIDLLGPAPTLTPAGADGSFSSRATTLHVPWGQSDKAGIVGGYTAGTWQGYTTELEVTVTFDTKGHGATPAPETNAEGFPYYSPTPDNDGDWWFLGWFTDPALTQPYAEGAPLARDLTLYAAWGHAYSEAGMTFLANATRPDDGATVMAYDPAVGGTTPVIPPSVTIGGQSFDVRTIAQSAFSGTGLTAVTIPSTVTTIGPYAFSDDPLEAVELPAGLQVLDYGAFWGDQLRSVVIPNGITVIGTRAFLQNQLESVVLPEGLTTIQSDAFATNELSSITLPDTLTSIYGSAFYDNQLTEVTIPASVTSLGTGAFDLNPQLTRVTLLGPAPAVTRAGSINETFDVSSGALVLDVPWRYTTGSGASYVVPRWNGYTTRAIATVTLDTAGGSAVPSIQEPVGGSLDAPRAPTRPGFSFTGWLAGGQPVDFPLAVTGDLTLTAGYLPADAPGSVAEVAPSTASALAVTGGASPSTTVLIGAAGAIALGMLVLGAVGLRRRLRHR